VVAQNLAITLLLSRKKLSPLDLEKMLACKLPPSNRARRHGLGNCFDRCACVIEGDLIVSRASFIILCCKPDHNLIEQHVAKLWICEITHWQEATAAFRAVDQILWVVPRAENHILKPVASIVFVLQFNYVAAILLAIVPVRFIPRHLHCSFCCMVINVEVDWGWPRTWLNQE
jgi:hypothetical protein